MEQFDKMMALVVKPVGNNPVYNCMLQINDESNGWKFSKAIGITGENDEPVSSKHNFRTGSITKLFTAAVILQLAEEKSLKPEDSFFDLINNETKKILSGLHVFEDAEYSNKISVLHLLQHRSGLPDYFSADERFLQYVMQNPAQCWSWQRVIEKYYAFDLNKKAGFIPGNGFHYSDTNYLLLAILIEQITGRSLQQVFRERIISPLRLTNTYLEFFETPNLLNPVVYPYYGKNSLANVNTSFDWGGGGLISSMDDLEVFIRGLVKGALFNKTDSLGRMMEFLETGNNTPQYGLGVQLKKFSRFFFAGHNSAYGSMVFYDSVREISIILSLNQADAMHKAEWLMSRVAESL